VSTLSRWLARLRDAPSPTALPEQSVWSVYPYLDKDGRFDYQRYRDIQVLANKRKIHAVWENIRFLADYIRKFIPRPAFGLCHGTRRGMEQQWFRRYLDCEVLGTEISDTARDFPDTIQWDFHEVKPEWLGAADFIYSNSLDHSYDPEKCLNAWVSCLRPDGILIVEHSTDHVEARETDPFGAHLAVLPYLILDWSKAAYSTREILRAPHATTVGGIKHESVFLIVKKN
jgi:SAM-dependent methyltransferase